MRPVPLKWRVCLLMTSGLIVVIATISIVAYRELHESLRGNVDQTLHAMANGIVAALDEARDSKELDAEARLITSASAKRPPPYRIWISGASEDLAPAKAAAGTPPGWLQNLPPAPEAGSEIYFEFAQDGEGYRAVWKRASSPRGQANIVVAYPTHHYKHEMHEFLRVQVLLGVGMVVGLAVLGSLTILWAMRPIDRAARRLREVTEQDLGSEKLDDLPMPVELRPFMRTVAELLARLGEVLRKQRRFTADASHELRTPLSVAKSTLQLARAKDRSVEQYRQAIDETLNDLDRMEKLVRQLLLLARLDETQATERFEDVPLDALLTELAAIFDARAAQAGGKVVCDDLPELHVRGEEGLLRQLLANLLDNAVRHGPRGGTVRVSLSAQDGRATVCVHDDGGNIPPAALEHLFDRFFRVDDSRNSDTGGAGLGLAIAREIARRHGGDIEIDSSPAAGTNTRVRLPAERKV